MADGEGGKAEEAGRRRRKVGSASASVKLGGECKGAVTHDKAGEDDEGLVRLLLEAGVGERVSSEDERAGERARRRREGDPAGRRQPPADPRHERRPFGRREDGGEVVRACE